MEKGPNPLKTTYQRNMLVGYFAAIILLLIGVIINFQDGNDLVIFRTADLRYINLKESEIPVVISGSNCSRMSFIRDGKGKNYKASQPIFHKPAIESIVSSQNAVFLPLFESPYPQKHFASMNGLTEDWVDWICNRGGSTLAGSWPNETSGSGFSPDYWRHLVRGITIPNNYNRNLLIDFVTPVYPRRGRGVDATVVLDLEIDQRGLIVKCSVITESPRGLGFATALKEALYESQISAPVVEGRTIACRFSLTYEFCWNCTRRFTTYHASDGISVTISDADRHR